MGDVDAGYVGTKDSNDPIVKISADLQYNDGMPSGYKMTMTGKSGKVYQVDAKILKSAQLPMQGSKDMMLIETISQTTMDGRVGFGIAEFLIPAKND
jgi:hypothetical protein